MKGNLHKKLKSANKFKKIDSILDLLQYTPLTTLTPPPIEGYKEPFDLKFDEPTFKEANLPDVLQSLKEHPRLGEVVKNGILQSLQLKKEIYNNLKIDHTKPIKNEDSFDSASDFTLAADIISCIDNNVLEKKMQNSNLIAGMSGKERVQNYIKSSSFDLCQSFELDTTLEFTDQIVDSSDGFYDCSITNQGTEAGLNSDQNTVELGYNTGIRQQKHIDLKIAGSKMGEQENNMALESTESNPAYSPNISPPKKIRKRKSDFAFETNFNKKDPNSGENSYAHKYTIDSLENVITDILEQKAFLDEDVNNFSIYSKRYKERYIVKIKHLNHVFISGEAIYIIWEHFDNIKGEEIKEKLDSYFLTNLFTILRKSLEINSTDTLRYIFKDTDVESDNLESNQFINDSVTQIDDLPLNERVNSVLSMSLVLLKTVVLLLSVISKNYLAKKNNTENILDDAVQAFSVIQNDIIAPIFERKSNEDSAKIAQSPFVSKRNNRSMFEELLNLARSAIFELSALVYSNMLSEKSIIKVSYAVIPQIFVHEIPPWLNQNILESIFRQCYSTICIIIESNESQRLWLLEEILTSVSKSHQFNKQSNLSRLVDNKAVRFITVFTFHIIQSSAVVKHQATELMKFIKNKKIRDEITQKEMFESAYEKAQSSAKTVISFLFKRCGKKAVKASIGSESYYKTLFDALVEDSILLASQQDWPSASLFLRVLTREIFKVLEDEKADVTQKSISIDYLAAIASMVAGSFTDLEDSEEMQMEGKEKEKEKDGRIKLGFEEDSFKKISQVLNDSNNNLSAVFLYSSEWVIENIKLTTPISLSDHREQQTPLDDLTQTGECRNGIHKKKPSKAARKQKKAKKNGNLDNSTNIMIKELYEIAQSVLKNSAELSGTSHTKFQMEISKAEKSCETCICVENHFGLQLLRGSFSKMLNYINVVLESNAIILRSKALKALGLIISKNPSILSNKLVKTAINNRLQDSSPLVRDAAVDLLGKYIINNTSLTRQYFKVLCARAMDKGPGVRKRVIRLLKEIYLKSNNSDLQPEIGLRLLHRTTDDERGVKDQAFKILKELWLSDLHFTSAENTKSSVSIGSSTTLVNDFNSASLNPHYTSSVLISANDPAVSTNTLSNIIKNEFATFFDLPEIFQRHYISTAKVLATMIAQEKGGGLNLKAMLVSFFNSFSSKETSSLVEVSDPQVLNNISKIISAIFELIILSKSQRLDEDSSSTKNPGFKIKNSTVNELDLLELALVFCKIDSKSISLYAPQLADNVFDSQDPTASEVLVVTMKIFTHVAREMIGVGRTFLSRLQQKLVLLLQSGPQSVLEAAVPCICAFIQHKTRNYQILSKILNYCVVQLDKSKGEFLSKLNNASYTKTTTRVIILSGLLVRHFDFDSYRKLSRKSFLDLNHTIPEPVSISDRVLSYFLFFIQSDQEQAVKAAALRMIGQLQIGRPELLIDERVQRIYESVLDGSQILFKHQLLSNLVQIVQSEIESTNKNLQKGTFEGNGNAEIDANMLAGKYQSRESGNVASVLQTYLDQILECILNTDLYQPDSIGFELLLLVINQGLVHPLKCMPALISIESLPKSPLRKKAAKAHLDISSKFESFIHSLDIDGVKLAYKTQLTFSRNLSHNIVGYHFKNIYKGSEYQIEAALQPLYDTIVTNKVKRSQFLKELVNLPFKNLISGTERVDYDYSSVSEEAHEQARLSPGASSGLSETITLQNGHAVPQANGTTVQDIAGFYLEHIPFVRYIMENLLSFKYSTVDEVLFVLNELSKMISSLGFSLLHRFESLNPLRNKVPINEIIETEVKNKDIIERDTVISIAVGSLLLLRETLKLSYKIPESKCNSYSSGDSSPSKEKAVFNPSNSLSSHWNLLGYTSKIENRNIDYIKGSNKVIAPSWKAWPYAVMPPESSEDFKRQMLLYCQLFTDLTSIHSVSFA